MWKQVFYRRVTVENNFVTLQAILITLLQLCDNKTNGFTVETYFVCRFVTEISFVHVYYSKPQISSCELGFSGEKWLNEFSSCELGFVGKTDEMFFLFVWTGFCGEKLTK